MRTIFYSVWHKETNTKVFESIKEERCLEKIDEFENKDCFEIRHKWQNV
jgi:hypothetical protein